MELGATLPLQRFLNMRLPPHGPAPGRLFCWDLHVISLRGRKSLLAVHCHSRYVVVRYDVLPVRWRELPDLFREGLTDSLTAAGFSREQIGRYLLRAGEPVLTCTHGRREVAFLNRAWEEVMALDLCVDTGTEAQPLLEHAVNIRPSRCAGAEGLGTGLERMAAVLENR